MQLKRDNVMKQCAAEGEMMKGRESVCVCVGGGGGVSQNVSSQNCREPSSVGWDVGAGVSEGGACFKNLSDSECPEIHYGYGIFEI